MKMLKKSLFLILAMSSAQCMSEQKEAETGQISEQSANLKKGFWIQKDKRETAVMIEWERFEGTTLPYIEQKKKYVHDKAITMAKHDEEIARVCIKYPEQFKLLDTDERELFTAMRDWFIAQKPMSEFHEQFLLAEYGQMAENLKLNGPGSTINFFVTVKELDGKLLGFAEFNVKPEYPKGDVQLETLGVLPSAQGRGLSRFLSFSVLQFYPTAKRIFLSTMQDCRNVYMALGFKPYKDLGELGIEFEYVIK